MSMVYTALVPTLSSNVSALIYSGQWSADYAAYKAFDGSLTTFWSATSNALTNQYVGYHFDAAVIVNRLGVVPRWRQSDSITMKDFKVQGSNDGSTWTDLYSGTVPNTQSISGTWVYYDFNNETAYTYYRLFIIDTYSSTSLTLFEAQFYHGEEPAPPPPPPRGFTVDIQSSSSEKNKVDKDVETIMSLRGTLKNGTSIIDPVILVNASVADLKLANYMTVEAFSRKYFITDITSVRDGLAEIKAHVDVLSSFAAEIRSNKAIISRQKSEYNLYLDDGSFKVYNNPVVITKPFPNGFTNQSFILAVAGG